MTAEKTEKTDSEVLFVRGVPADLKRHFKALCASSGLTMQEYILYLMRVAVQGATEPKKEIIR